MILILLLPVGRYWIKGLRSISTNGRSASTNGSDAGRDLVEAQEEDRSQDGNGLGHFDYLSKNVRSQGWIWNQAFSDVISLGSSIFSRIHPRMGLPNCQSVTTRAVPPRCR